MLWCFVAQLCVVKPPNNSGSGQLSVSHSSCQKIRINRPQQTEQLLSNRQLSKNLHQPAATDRTTLTPGPPNSLKKRKTTQAVKTTPHIASGKESHFGTEYRKTPLPADKKGPVREVQQSTRRKKENNLHRPAATDRNTLTPGPPNSSCSPRTKTLLKVQAQKRSTFSRLKRHATRSTHQVCVLEQEHFPFAKGDSYAWVPEQCIWYGNALTIAWCYDCCWHATVHIVNGLTRQVQVSTEINNTNNQTSFTYDI